MLFYVACALLLLNAQTTLAWSLDPSRLCEDYLEEKFCLMFKKRGECHLGSKVEFTERFCWKTCGNCTPVTPKPKETCFNKADAKTCYGFWERGQCEIAKDICAKTCYYCDS